MALMAASQNGHTETAATLITAGAKLDLQTKVREGSRACGSCCSSMCVCVCCVRVCMCVCVHTRAYVFSLSDTYLLSVKDRREIERGSPAHVCP